MTCLSHYSLGKARKSDQFKFLGDCPPTPPLSQHFALLVRSNCKCWRSRKGVGGSNLLVPDFFDPWRKRYLSRQIVNSRNRTAERGGRQNACVWQTWQGYFLRVFSWSSLTLIFSGLLQKDMFKGGWSSAKRVFKQNYCQPCHTRFSVFFPPPSCFISSLLTVTRPTTNDNFRKNICSEDDLRSRIFGTFVVKFFACLPLLGFSNI